VTNEPNSLAWRKSTFSGGGNDCVEMADTGDPGIAMRNSHFPDRGTIIVDRDAFANLVSAVKAGEIDDLA
jgi:hypothetical protein